MLLNVFKYGELCGFYRVSICVWQLLKIKLNTVNESTHKINLKYSRSNPLDYYLFKIVYTMQMFCLRQLLLIIKFPLVAMYLYGNPEHTVVASSYFRLLEIQLLLFFGLKATHEYIN